LIVKVYTLFDEKAAFYGSPFYCKTDNEALRMVSDAARSTETLIGTHPEDYSLYNVGQFDDNAGKLIPENVPVFIVKVTELVTRLPQP